MRIVEINTVCGKSGSVGRMTAELLNYAHSCGVDAYAAYSRGKAVGINEKRGITISSRTQFYFAALNARLKDNDGFNSVRATKKLIERLESLKPDAVHLHNAHGYYLNIELLFDYLKRSGVKLVWTLHDCWAFTGHCAYFGYVGCEKWKTGCNDCPQMREYPKAFVDNSKGNYIRKKEIFTSLPRENVIITTPSCWLKDIAEQSFLGEYPIEVIPNGIDMLIFSYPRGRVREKLALGDKKLALCVANVWDGRKGFKDVAALARRLPQYAFIVIGLNKSEERAPDNVITIERTNNARTLAAYYSAADVFVNPTYDDNYPTTHMEAQACGTAVVSYDTGGCKENILAPYGACVKKGDIEELTAAVQRTAESGYDKAELSLRSREAFDKTLCFSKYVSLYKRITGDKRA